MSTAAGLALYSQPISIIAQASALAGLGRPADRQTDSDSQFRHGGQPDTLYPPVVIWKLDRLNDIGRLQSYADDWDFLGAAAVSAQAVKALKAFVSQLCDSSGALVACSRPSIYPSPDGSVNIMWRGSQHNVRVVARADDSTIVSYVDYRDKQAVKNTGSDKAVDDVLNLLSIEA